MAKREHRITHPVMGLATWQEMRAAAQERRDRGERLCTWCFGPLRTARQQSRCSEACGEMMRRAYMWQYTASLVIRRDGGACVLCRCRYCTIEVDHIIPVSLGGSGDLDNLRSLCSDCHKSETARLRREKDRFVAAKIIPLSSCNQAAL